MSIRNSAPLAIASMALGLAVGTALSNSAAQQAPCPTVTVVPSPVFISPGAPVTASEPATNPLVDVPKPPPSLATLRPSNAGEPVSEGAKVLARWYDDTWWEATVTAANQGTVTVAWADGSPPNQLPSSDVAALPVQASSVGVGSYAICSWQSSTQWWRARIADRQGVPTIEYIDGDSATLGVERCVLARFAD